MASQALRLFEKHGKSGFGRWLYSRLICLRAPYFGSIGPTVQMLEPGRCVVTIRHRRRVQNHIGTVHAIALCNMAEMAGGLATDATIPATTRWIPKGMSVRYLKKATGTMTATARVAAVADASVAQDLHAIVEVRDAAGDVVFDADITMWVSPKKG
ncbi:hotdog fold domain-containing protein [Tahibacter soli]|uniref:Hotdog fold domain-containing protein n=1 Tax=Tahibacter soli TaxID=2983605 RepID=A0A9X3YGY6_9GAMM|nr:hotdog fold domain-containing protein [Tahibacter soli]MDC8011297.1 hotdog fold domain-containing protein [Tahibacter soli]